MVQQLEYLTNSLSTNPTSNDHRQAALQLEIEVDRWYSAFCSLVKSQRDYVYSLTSWLRLSLFQCHHNPLVKKIQNSDIYSLCEEWQLAIDRIPDKVASEGINTLLSVIHAVIVQQVEEQKQKMGALDDSEVPVFLFGGAHTHYSGGAGGDVFALFNGNVRVD
jgi:hypothetical protein